MISIPTKNGEEFQLSDNLYNEFFKAYPNVDIDGELKKMRVWSLSNPSRRKTKRGMKRFINSWLSNARPSTGIRSTKERSLEEDLMDRSWAE